MLKSCANELSSFFFLFIEVVFPKLFDASESKSVPSTFFHCCKKLQEISILVFNNGYKRRKSYISMIPYTDTKDKQTLGPTLEAVKPTLPHSPIFSILIFVSL